MSDPRLAALAAQLHAGIQRELPAAERLRREVHGSPRISHHEEDTAVLVADALGVPLDRVAGTGRIGRVGPTTGGAVALRAELDALPVTEATGSPHAATNGAMHACGHDVHLAGLVAVVRAASARNASRNAADAEAEPDASADA